jgi:DNA-binding transcriptional LysR family regulator
LVEDKLDLGLVEGEVTLPDIVQRPFAEDELTLICGRAHPYFGRDSVSPRELEAQNFILREVGSGTRRTFETVMTEHALNWKASWTCNNADTIKAAVAEGLGVSVISRRAVEREVAAGLLRPVSVEGLSFVRWFKLIHHKNKYLTGAMKAFIAFCLSGGAEGPDDPSGEAEDRV